MGPPLEPDPKEKLNKLLLDSEKVGAEGLEKSQNAAEGYADMARRARFWIPLVPLLTGQETEEVLARWGNYYGTGTYGIQRFGGVGEALSSSGSGLGFYTSDAIETNMFAARIANSGSPAAIAALRDLKELDARAANGDRVLGLMQSLGLNKRFSSEKLSPLEEYQIALNAQRRPVSIEPVPAITSLIPLRSAIDGAIDQLWGRRRNRTNLVRAKEEDHRWMKIKAIGEDLKHDAVSKGQPEQWANDGYNLFKKDLVPSKEARVSLTEWERSFRRGTLFLLSFLGGLDPGKVREAPTPS